MCAFYTQRLACCSSVAAAVVKAGITVAKKREVGTAELALNYFQFSDG